LQEGAIRINGGSMIVALQEDPHQHVSWFSLKWRSDVLR
jgi:hypothetical protein